MSPTEEARKVAVELALAGFGHGTLKAGDADQVLALAERIHAFITSGKAKP